MRIFARGSPGARQSGTGAGWSSLKVAVLDEQREQRGGDALPHRPALELRVLRDARRVALGDDPALVDDDEGGGERVGIGTRCRQPPHGAWPRRVPAGSGSLGRRVAHRPRRRRGIGRALVTGTGGSGRRHARLVDDAALIAVELGLPGDAARHRDPDQLVLAIDLRVGDLVMLGDEVVDGRMLDAFGRVPTRDEHRRAEDLRRPGGRPAVGLLGGNPGWAWRSPPPR